MANGREVPSTLEWRVHAADGTVEILVQESGTRRRLFRRIHGLVVAFLIKLWTFFIKAWNIGVNDPRKFIHCLKVGTALSLVSLFYYMRTLYQGVGGNAMWAVMTVVVVFEYSIGATLYKCVNRATGTLLAGSLGFGVHWIAIQCGENIQPIILEISVFLLAAAATFSRFIPTVKARFDYGAMVFILTFCLVSISGYRVDQLFGMAHHRLLTVALGASICIITSMLVCPIWAGQELHTLINRNLEKLSESLDGCVTDFFADKDVINVSNGYPNKMNQAYKCVLNSKGSEESMANFARWEPAHGDFKFRHPWKQYLKVGAAIRSCAYCIETLNGCINSDIRAPETLKKHLKDMCVKLSSYSSNVIKELAIIMKTMTKSPSIHISIGQMNVAVHELQDALKNVPNQVVVQILQASNDGMKGETTNTRPLLEILPLATVASLLVELAARIEVIVKEVDQLADQAEFSLASNSRSKASQPIA
ncbi:Aluminum-activated malate transporter 10 [Heracleum sosnowskyi]|uniref:Aluminum-activated malate transporter 10 n=1 Tax=Heracleum sosnowskyi TaxID=360622 RepID=A0AAD8MHW0_9APIA|nr:Aluminum-activated malate transporter 10 [Heracleum sosnowskyi]